MSALEQLWAWLQGHSSQMEARPDRIDAKPQQQEQSLQEDVNAASRKADELDARVQRHSRYRAGPWQMK